jgi:hypothetical protein
VPSIQFGGVSMLVVVVSVVSPSSGMSGAKLKSRRCDSVEPSKNAPDGACVSVVDVGIIYVD